MDNVKVRITYAGGRTEERELSPGKYQLGREAGDIVLEDPNVSARHAEIEVHAGQLCITDLGSSNGTFDGAGQRLAAPHQVAPGESVRLGGSSITRLAPAALPGGTRLMPQAAAGGTRLMPQVSEAALPAVAAPPAAPGAASTGSGAPAAARQRGTVIKVPDSGPGLVMVDGAQRPFELGGTWRSPIAPAINQVIDLELDANGKVTSITVVDAQALAKEKLGQLGEAARRQSARAAGVALEQGQRAAVAARDSLGAAAATPRGRRLLAGAAAGAMVLVGGLLWVLSRGDDSEVSLAKNAPEEVPVETAEGDVRLPGLGYEMAAAQPAAPPATIHYEKRAQQPPPKLATSDHDIVGLKLGMTPSQAISIRADANPVDKYGRGGLTISLFDQSPLQEGQNKSPYQFVWGSKHNRFGYDPNDSRYVVVSITGREVGLTFALPPEPNVVIGISRSAQHHDAQKNEGTSYDLFTQALQDKYGNAADVVEPLRTSRTEVAGKAFKWLASGADCGTMSRNWGTRKGTRPDQPAPEDCGTLLTSEVYYYQSGPYQGMVSSSVTRLINDGDVFLNRQRHEIWLAATKANWEKARNEKIRAAAKDTKAPTL